MRRTAHIVVIALVAASCGGGVVGTTTTQPGTTSTLITAPTSTTTTIEVTTTTVSEPTTTTIAPDPLSCGPEEAAIVAGGEPSMYLLTPGLVEPVCARSAIDPTWATLRWTDSPDGDDALLLHLDAGGWVVIEEPPSYEDADRRTYYFFGCAGPVELVHELDLC
ncbi:MAG: hypothetical protein WEE53_09880 [Acidimicrobiia bacterium]